MSDDEISKAARDAFTYGTGFMRDGKHVPMEDVYMTAKDKMTDNFPNQLRRQFPIDMVLQNPGLVMALYVNERDHAADIIEDQQKRIEKLEYFLKVRDDFLDKHYLWQELVIALEEKKDV